MGMEAENKALQAKVDLASATETELRANWEDVTLLRSEISANTAIIRQYEEIIGECKGKLIMFEKVFDLCQNQGQGLYIE